MKRIFVLGFLLACGGADDLAFDASVDQTTDQSAVDAPADVVTKDAGGDSTVDAKPDVGADAIADSPITDAILLDVPVVDVISIDAPNGCTSNASCTNVIDFCDKGTANCGGTGTCKPKPQNCPQVYNPVCGCDKKTYTNSCFANQGGVSVAYSGVCE